MGLFSVNVRVGARDGGATAPALAVVDTGAADSVMPASFLEGLGIQPLYRGIYTLADGSQREYGRGIALIAIDGVKGGIEGLELPCPVVFGDDEGGYMLGATALEFFDVTIDPVDQRLTRRPKGTLRYHP